MPAKWGEVFVEISTDSPEVGRFLEIDHFKFVLSEESISHEYTSGAQYLRSMPGRTHPAMIQLMEGGRIGPLQFSVELVCGGADVASWAKPRVDTPEHLMTVVEALHDMALPSLRGRGVKIMDAFLVKFMGSGSPWLVRRGVLRSINCEFSAPWDVETGLPYRAKIDFEFLVAMFATTREGEGGRRSRRAARRVDDALLPHRPWRFNEPWGSS